MAGFKFDTPEYLTVEDVCRGRGVDGGRGWREGGWK